jgi:hypothetical protein
MSRLAIPNARKEPTNFRKELRMQRATLVTTGRRILEALGETVAVDMSNHAMGTDGVVGTD